MGEKSLGQIFLEGFVRAIPWAIVFSAALVLSAGIIANILRVELKKAMEFGSDTLVNSAVDVILTDPRIQENLWPKAKQNVKEAIEYTAVTLAQQQAKVSERRAAAKK
jgi:hypothetical protein